MIDSTSGLRSRRQSGSSVPSTTVPTVRPRTKRTARKLTTRLESSPRRSAGYYSSERRRRLGYSIPRSIDSKSACMVNTSSAFYHPLRISTGPRLVLISEMRLYWLCSLIPGGRHKTKCRARTLLTVGSEMDSLEYTDGVDRTGNELNNAVYYQLLFRG